MNSSSRFSPADFRSQYQEWKQGRPEHAAPRDTDMGRRRRRNCNALGEASVRRAFRQYEDDRYFRDLQAALAALMTERAETAESWEHLIDGVEGRGQIRLMTIHKSKGLEYHTIIFVGLHHNAFWGYRNNREEETNTFFVALSRARERVYSLDQRKAAIPERIRELVGLLEYADVRLLKASDGATARRWFANTSGPG